jgi:hypothetical protein
VIKFDKKELDPKRLLELKLDVVAVFITAVVMFAMVELRLGKVALLEFKTVVFSACPCCAKMRFATVKLLESVKNENRALGPMIVLLKVMLQPAIAFAAIDFASKFEIATLL